MKCGTLKWLGHEMKINEDGSVKQPYKGRIEGGNILGRSLVKQINKVDEYCRERAQESKERNALLWAPL